MIRSATASDTDNLAVLSIHVWLDTYAVQGIRRDYSQFVLAEFTPQAYEHMLDDPHTTILVYEHDDILQGFAVLKDAAPCPNHTATIELTKLYVHAKWQGQGIGRALLEACCQQTHNNLWLRTWSENQANGFYESAGLVFIAKEETQFGEHRIVNNLYAATPETFRPSARREVTSI